MINVYIHMLAKFLLVLGSINYLFLAGSNVNIFNVIPIPMLRNSLFLLIGLSALYFAFNRDYYLPFLGQCVIPSGDANIPQENAKQVTVSNLPPNTRVIFWAAQGDGLSSQDPITAYGDYANSGTIKTDNNGSATISLNCPSQYSVSKFGFRKALARHFHYRYEIPTYKGIFSRVYTQKIIC